MSCLVLTYVAISILLDRGHLSPDFKLNNVKLIDISFFERAVFIILSSVNLLVVYCVYLFRQIVKSFSLLDVFEYRVIKNFSKIGNYLIIIGASNIIIGFLTAFYFNHKIEAKIEFGGNSFGFICLGLFCIVLSEIFKIAKSLKQENDLTI